MDTNIKFKKLYIFALLLLLVNGILIFIVKYAQYFYPKNNSKSEAQNSLLIPSPDLAQNLNIPDAKNYFCDNQNKYIGIKEEGKTSVFSLCERMKIYEYQEFGDEYSVVGRGGILKITQKATKISVPYPVSEGYSPGDILEEDKYAYSLLQYFSFTTGKWINLKIPKLLDTATKYESLFFTPSIDNSSFVVEIRLYDTNSSQFFGALNGTEPISRRYLTLNPEKGIYASYNFNRAAQAIIQFENRREHVIFEYSYCHDDALATKKLYARPCGEGAQNLGPIHEYNFANNKVKLLTSETSGPELNEEIHHLLPIEYDYIYYVSEPNKENNQTRFSAFKIGDQESQINISLNDVDLMPVEYRSQELNIITDSSGLQLYFPKYGISSNLSNWYLNLVKTPLKGDNSITEVSPIDGVSSCGNNALVYKPHDQDSIVYINADISLKVDLPDFENLVKPKEKYQQDHIISWCH